jgi:hypothetical protein
VTCRFLDFSTPLGWLCCCFVCVCRADVTAEAQSVSCSAHVGGLHYNRPVPSTYFPFLHSQTNLKFDSVKMKNISHSVLLPTSVNHRSFHSVHIDPGAHSASCPMGTWASFPGSKAAGAVKPITHLHLVLKSRTVKLYLHFPIRLHGIVIN